jgi:hypothetical protein
MTQKTISERKLKNKRIQSSDSYNLRPRYRIANYIDRKFSPYCPISFCHVFITDVKLVILHATSVKTISNLSTNMYNLITTMV